jgi:Uma2 family endonuclease
LAIAVEPFEELPAIDERLALPEAGYEIIDGVVTFVAPADPPHGERHATVAALIRSHVESSFKVAVDMLTRTSKIDDIAPDVSVFPRAPHPKTGGRQLEQLAFEIVSTQSMSDATAKAAKLAGRGVRRVFAIDLTRRRVLEWSQELATWIVLDPSSWIEDPALAVSLSIGALMEIVDADDEVVRAHVARHHPAIEAVRAEGRAEGHAEGYAVGTAESIVHVLVARGLQISEHQRELIVGERDAARLAGWLRRSVSCQTVDELLA